MFEKWSVFLEEIASQAVNESLDLVMKSCEIMDRWKIRKTSTSRKHGS